MSCLFHMSRSRILIRAAPCGGLRRPAVPLRRPKKRLDRYLYYYCCELRFLNFSSKIAIMHGFSSGSSYSPGSLLYVRKIWKSLRIEITFAANEKFDFVLYLRKTTLCVFAFLNNLPYGTYNTTIKPGPGCSKVE